MDLWEKLYQAAKKDYNPHYVTPFIYSNHVVAAIEAEDGQIFTGYCFEATSGVFIFVRNAQQLLTCFNNLVKPLSNVLLHFGISRLMVKVQE